MSERVASRKNADDLILAGAIAISFLCLSLSCFPAFLTKLAKVRSGGEMADTYV